MDKSLIYKELEDLEKEQRQMAARVSKQAARIERIKGMLATEEKQDPALVVALAKRREKRFK